jgi:Ser/Thr protein kinase RdoA (MazF antagonist)
MSPLDGFESFIYRFQRPDGEFILRIGHSGRRSPEMIHGEVDWINYLSDHGVTVARAILSTSRNLVEAIEDEQGGQFLCTAFVRAPGGEIQREQINERFFRAYGSLIGKMHALSKTYEPSNPAWRREEWDGESNNTVDRQLPAAETAMQEIYHRLFIHLQGLPCEAGGYGIIHQDAHPGNFFIDENYTMTLFDFDDCVYGHFIYDIAMVIFYVSLQEKDPAAFMERFLPVFLTAYSRENRLDPGWLKEIPNFLKLREIDLFAAILFTFGEHPADQWAARYMQGRRERIEKDVPFLEFEWESMARYLQGSV